MHPIREQARQTVLEAVMNLGGISLEGDCRITADAASDVWEPILREIDRIQQDWWNGEVPMNVALSEIRQVVQEALGG